MQEKLEYETSVTEVLMKDAFVASAAAPEDPYDSEGSISGGISETSHELGAQLKLILGAPLTKRSRRGMGSLSLPRTRSRSPRANDAR
jgi:hypothetical protein